MGQVQLTYHMAAKRERLFATWTEPGLLARWWGPAAEAEVDLRVGGGFRLSMQLDWGALVAVGEYLEIREPEWLRFTWVWEGDEQGEQSVVTLEFREAGTGTDLILTHSGLPDGPVAENHKTGWNDCIARLVSLTPALEGEIRFEA